MTFPDDAPVKLVKAYTTVLGATLPANETGTVQASMESQTHNRVYTIHFDNYGKHHGIPHAVLTKA
ncbi:hypothetical protein M413DRAFT_439085 [Hebeloma cylindrosporum]|uniref:Uncharacterized protein n=1 Tax=Hebeloma cylindrosporum TaxID=76867 RepID=A0A0C2Z2E5_HEBCY|nr:hypothetical protein M413DRAFT_439085 [Hebeloma cylindrosporum h7]